MKNARNMAEPVTTAAESQPPPQRERELRPRSVPSAQPFRVAVFYSALHYLALITTVTALACVFAHPSQLASRIMVMGLIFSGLTWLFAFFKRRNTHCPLCKGTPLLNSGARPHVRARRIHPLNHGVTAVLSILASQKFRCMYCGSDYDLLKPPTRLLHGRDAGGNEAAQDKRS